MLRPLSLEDRDGLYAAASDPLIWEQHPAKTRYERPVFDLYFDHLLGTGSALVVLDGQSQRIIGTSSYYSTPEDPPARSIGFTFLERAFWGGETNFDLKSLMIDHILAHFDAVWFHIGPDNLRSQRATAKLGALPEPARRLNLGTGAAEYVCLKLTRAAWEERKAAPCT
ncbi:MAG: GNAT family N-acetyltransferase [Pseudomonadota bacterium]